MFQFNSMKTGTSIRIEPIWNKKWWFWVCSWNDAFISNLFSKLRIIGLFCYKIIASTQSWILWTILMKKIQNLNLYHNQNVVPAATTTWVGFIKGLTSNKLIIWAKACIHELINGVLLPKICQMQCISWIRVLEPRRSYWWNRSKTYYTDCTCIFISNQENIIP